MTDNYSDGTERTFECESCEAKYNTYGRHCPLRSCYECGERNPWRQLQTDTDRPGESDQ